MTDALDDRRPVDGEIDFTMMYAAHDAFGRDLNHLVQAASEAGWQPADRRRWSIFVHQLHVHHHAEDVSLWPAVRATGADPQAVATLDAMEAEHGYLEPAQRAVEQAIATGDRAAQVRALEAMQRGLAGHMRHEENAALPLVATRLGPAGWRAFTGTFRETQGLRGAATYFPWLLEDAPRDVAARVLHVLPPPVRLVYRAVWAPRYRRSLA